MYKYIYFLLYTHQLKYLQKANSYMQTNLVLIPDPHILLKGFHSHLISGLFGESQAFQTRCLCILERIFDFNTYKDNVRQNNSKFWCVPVPQKLAK